MSVKRVLVVTMKSVLMKLGTLVVPVKVVIAKNLSITQKDAQVRSN